MFTGIITDVGRVRTVESAGDTRFEITTGTKCCRCLTVYNHTLDGIVLLPCMQPQLHLLQHVKTQSIERRCSC